MIKHFCIGFTRSAIVACVMLCAACGGSGSSTQSNNTTAPPPAYLVEFDFANNARIASISTLESIDIATRIAAFSERVINLDWKSINGTEFDCFTLNYSPNWNRYSITNSDGSSEIKSGSEISITQDCFSAVWQRWAFGETKITVLEADKDEHYYRLEIEPNELDFKNEFNSYKIIGKFEVELWLPPFAYDFRVKSLGSIQVLHALRERVANELNYTLTDIDIKRNEDFQTARYEITADGKIKIDNLEGEITFASFTPFESASTCIPTSGHLRLYSGDSYKYSIVADGTPIIKMGNDFTTDRWEQSYDGFSLNIINLDRFVVQNTEGGGWFSYVYCDRLLNIGILDEDERENRAHLQPLEVIFNQPISAINGSVEFVQYAAPYDAIPHRVQADFELFGGVVVFTPKQPLRAGLEYKLEASNLESEISMRESIQTTAIKTLDNVTGLIGFDSLYYSKDHAPQASISYDFDRGERVMIDWSVKEDASFKADSPNALSTTFKIPDGYSEPFTAVATVYNEFGDALQQEFTFDYVNDNKNHMAVKYLTQEAFKTNVYKEYYSEDETQVSVGASRAKYVPGISLRFNERPINQTYQFTILDSETLRVGKFTFDSSLDNNTAEISLGISCTHRKSEFEILSFKLSEDQKSFQKLQMRFFEHCIRNGGNTFIGGSINWDADR